MNGRRVSDLTSLHGDGSIDRFQPQRCAAPIDGSVKGAAALFHSIVQREITANGTIDGGRFQLKRGLGGQGNGD